MHTLFTLMNLHRTATQLLTNSPLNTVDTARLILEVTEALHAEHLPRAELLSLIRETFHSGIQAVRRSRKTVSFREAAQQSISARSERRPSTRRDLRHFIRRLLRVEGWAEKPLRSITTQECRKALEQAFGGSLHSYRKGRAILHSVFSFGQRQGWCSDNPVSSITAPQVEEKPIPPLSLSEIRRLEEAAARPPHREMRLSLQLMLYCGIRPGEILRLRPEDIRWKERCVIIRPSTSKTGGGRIIPLRKFPRPQPGELLIPRNWEIKWRALRQAAGFREWRPDALRHTFASYHAGFFRNLPALQTEMGHRSITLLRTRYVSPVLPGTARAFWKKDTGKGMTDFRPEKGSRPRIEIRGRPTTL